MTELWLELNGRNSPQTWVGAILESARAHSECGVEHKLVEAVLQRRFRGIDPFPYDSFPQQRVVGQAVYCVTTDPSRESMQECLRNTRLGYHSILLVPRERVEKATVLAQEEGMETRLAIFAIEDFIATIIIGLATEESKDLFIILKEIVEIYNRRLSEVETDLSLLIEVR